MMHTITGLNLKCHVQRIMLYIGMAGLSGRVSSAAAKGTMSLLCKSQKPSLSHNS